MSISIYFGLPGAGKSTMIAYMARKYINGKRGYKNVYSNMNMDLEGYWKIGVDDFGKYNIHDGIVLFDEATIGMSNRASRDLPKRLIDWFILHRHYRTDVLLFTQRWDGIDKTLRIIADSCFYVHKGIILGKWFTSYYQIPYDIIIPDADDGSGENLGEIVQGYCQPHRLAQIFCHRVYRPRYYKMFDSFEAPPLPALPIDRQYHKSVQKAESEPTCQDIPLDIAAGS